MAFKGPRNRRTTRQHRQREIREARIQKDVKSTPADGFVATRQTSAAKNHSIFYKMAMNRSQRVDR